MKRFALALLTVAAALVGVTGIVGQRPAAAATSVTLTGHGWGHGRGMGQWGALGYALDPYAQSYTQILDHYYGGTVLGTTPNSVVTVHLEPQDAKPTAVFNDRGHLTIASASGPIAGPFLAVRATKTAANTFFLEASTACTGSWLPLTTVTGPVTISSTGYAASPEDRTEMVQLCGTSSATFYRGALMAVDGDGTQRTVSAVNLEDYIRDVINLEMSPSWANLGGGKGAEALKAQAVAARSYALARNYKSWAQSCTVTCQSYTGKGVQAYGGSYVEKEDARTDAAVSATAGQVRRSGTTAGPIVATEFSASTGGYTAGGTFPAVEDLGDAYPSNPNHNWSTSIPVATIESAYGKGTLQSIAVTGRTGLGADGGRVTAIHLVFSGGTIDRTGDQFRITFGLKSNWYSVTGGPGVGASGGVSGYWITNGAGKVATLGPGATSYGDLAGIPLAAPVVGMARTVTSHGYWLLGRDGGVFSFGDAQFHGSTGAVKLNSPVLNLVATPTGAGYWFVAGDGGIFSFGDAQFYGSTGNITLNQPVVGMAATTSGHGYWLVARDGGIFSFGDAGFFGSTGATKLAQPIVAMAPTPSGKGYWLVGGDGGIFGFGDAAYLGSMPSRKVACSARMLVPTATGEGYAIICSNGVVGSFGDAPTFGDITDPTFGSVSAGAPSAA